MASFDFTKYDKYTFDLTLIPQGVLKATGVNEPDVAGKITPVSIPTPDNFKQFPNQRVFFEFNGCSFNSNDQDTMLPEADKVYTYFVTLDAPSRWCYDNLSNITHNTGDVNTHTFLTTNDGQSLAKLTQGKVPFTVVVQDDTNGDTARIYSESLLNRNIIQIGSPFGSDLNIQFKSSNSDQTIYNGVADTGPLRYNNHLSAPLSFKSPVSISFGIYVERDYREVEAFQKLRIN